MSSQVVMSSSAASLTIDAGGLRGGGSSGFSPPTSVMPDANSGEVGVNPMSSSPTVDDPARPLPVSDGGVDQGVVDVLVVQPSRSNSPSSAYTKPGCLSPLHFCRPSLQ
ncbi:hypothetical protein KC19_VG084900 [Ceratodon purpureus]|uniref:Uncharacterized protein n=1 Tax=Ceratodon purpureus TaxID=3225 RepID=A0A8T0HNA8_CERPU|nr:hypothetical protein KC19_VG084900 [Ceratodon purpureus]